MARLMHITGFKAIEKNLKKVTNDLGRGFARGMSKAGLFLQRESQKIVPVQTGNLKGSAYTRNIGGSGFRTDIVVGYSDEAGYAIYVHEDLEAKHGAAFNREYAEEIAAARPNHPVWFSRGEGQQAKFLEKPAREKRGEILRIIKKGTY